MSKASVVSEPSVSPDVLALQSELESLRRKVLDLQSVPIAESFRVREERERFEYEASLVRAREEAERARMAEIASELERERAIAAVRPRVPELKTLRKFVDAAGSFAANVRVSASLTAGLGNGSTMATERETWALVNPVIDPLLAIQGAPMVGYPKSVRVVTAQVIDQFLAILRRWGWGELVTTPADRKLLVEGRFRDKDAPWRKRELIALAELWVAIADLGAAEPPERSVVQMARLASELSDHVPLEIHPRYLGITAGSHGLQSHIKVTDMYDEALRIHHNRPFLGTSASSGRLSESDKKDLHESLKPLARMVGRCEED